MQEYRRLVFEVRSAPNYAKGSAPAKTLAIEGVVDYKEFEELGDDSSIDRT